MKTASYQMEYRKDLTVTQTAASQTLESFIRENGGIVKFEKHATFAYGLKPEKFHAAINKARSQDYNVYIDSTVVCGFRYWKRS